MTNDIEIHYQPRLNWPAGYERTKSYARKEATFSRGNPIRTPGGAHSGKVRMSVYTACERLALELRRFTRTGQDWRIPEAIMTADLPTLARGGFRSDRAEPADPGFAVYFTLDGREIVLACDKWDRVERETSQLTLL